MKKLFSYFFTAKDRLTKMGEKQPLSFLSLGLIIALDIFVLVNIFQGLHFQISQLKKPTDVIPYECSSLTSTKTTIPDYERKTVFSALSSYSDYYQERSYKYSANYINEKKKNEIDEKCREIFDAGNTLRADNQIKEWNQKIKDLDYSIRQKTSTISTRQRDYDTMLLERIAGQQEEESIIEGRAQEVREEVDALDEEIRALQKEKVDYVKRILSSSDSQAFLQTIKENRNEINDRLSWLKFWYPLKRTAFQFVFLIPLLVVFFWLYKRSVKKENDVLVLVFAHLLVVVSIPIVLELFRFLLEVIPFHFLADLLEVLEALDLIIIWNYLLIIIGILVAIGLIYFVQKKLDFRHRIYLKRIGKGQCCFCGAKRVNKADYCYKCGQQNMVECQKCHQKTLGKGKYCVACGSKDFADTPE
jgi:hypothetical protein